MTGPDGIGGKPQSDAEEDQPELTEAESGVDVALRRLSDTIDALPDRPREAPVAPTGPDVGQLLQYALEQGVDVDVMGKLVDLQERLSKQAATAAMTEALTAFQRATEPIERNREADVTMTGGGSFQYTYASLDQIVRTIAPLLAEHGLTYSWDMKIEQGGLMTVLCRLFHRLGGERTARFTCPTDTNAAMSAQQKYAAALTYARRQSLVSVLGLTIADDDADGAEPISAEPVTEAQVKQLSDLMSESGADRPAFLAVLEVDDIRKLPAARFDEAVSLLERKKKQRAEKRDGGGDG